MEHLQAVIPAPSEKQAMDWSLVLTSQGIEHGIERDADSLRLVLCLRPEDRPRAIQAIRLYERENRPRRWIQPIKAADLLLDWRALAALVPLPVLFLFTDVADLHELKERGLMDGHRVLDGQWWRLITAMTLHADVAHLAGNMTTGVLFLGLAMGAMGAGRALLSSLLAGVGGNLLALLVNGPEHRSLGASGMILGALGLLVAHSWQQWHAGEARGTLWPRALGGGIFLLLMLGASPRSDLAAHLGGFAAGLLLGMILAFWQLRVLPSPRADNLCAWAALASVTGAWILALRG